MNSQPVEDIKNPCITKISDCFIDEDFIWNIDRLDENYRKIRQIDSQAEWHGYEVVIFVYLPDEGFVERVKAGYGENVFFGSQVFRSISLFRRKKKRGIEIYALCTHGSQEDIGKFIDEEFSFQIAKKIIEEQNIERLNYSQTSYGGIKKEGPISQLFARMESVRGTPRLEFCLEYPVVTEVSLAYLRFYDRFVLSDVYRLLNAVSCIYNQSSKYKDLWEDTPLANENSLRETDYEFYDLLRRCLVPEDDESFLPIPWSKDNDQPLTLNKKHVMLDIFKDKCEEKYVDLSKCLNKLTEIEYNNMYSIYNEFLLEKGSVRKCKYLVGDRMLTGYIELFDLMMLDEEQKVIYLYQVKDGFDNSMCKACSQIDISAKNIKRSLNPSSRDDVITDFYEKVCKNGTEEHIQRLQKIASDAAAFKELFSAAKIVYVVAFSDNSIQRKERGRSIHELVHGEESLMLSEEDPLLKTLTKKENTLRVLTEKLFLKINEEGNYVVVTDQIRKISETDFVRNLNDNIGEADAIAAFKILEEKARPMRKLKSPFAKKELLDLEKKFRKEYPEFSLKICSIKHPSIVIRKVDDKRIEFFKEQDRILCSLKTVWKCLEDKSHEILNDINIRYPLTDSIQDCLKRNLEKMNQKKTGAKSPKIDCTRDCHCFYKTLSQSFLGKQDFHVECKIRVFIELVTNEARYTSEDEIRKMIPGFVCDEQILRRVLKTSLTVVDGEISKEELFKEQARCTLQGEGGTDLVHFLAAANVFGVPFVAMDPIRTHNPTDIEVYPISGQRDPEVFILWPGGRRDKIQQGNGRKSPKTGTSKSGSRRGSNKRRTGVPHVPVTKQNITGNGDGRSTSQQTGGHSSNTSSPMKREEKTTGTYAMGTSYDTFSAIKREDLTSRTRIIGASSNTSSPMKREEETSDQQTGYMSSDSHGLMYGEEGATYQQTGYVSSDSDSTMYGEEGATYQQTGYISSDSHGPMYREEVATYQQTGYISSDSHGPMYGEEEITGSSINNRRQQFFEKTLNTLQTQSWETLEAIAKEQRDAIPQEYGIPSTRERAPRISARPVWHSPDKPNWNKVELVKKHRYADIGWDAVNSGIVTLETSAWHVPKRPNWHKFEGEKKLRYTDVGWDAVDSGIVTLGRNFYETLSRQLFGTGNYHQECRIRIILELILNKRRYRRIMKCKRIDYENRVLAILRSEEFTELLPCMAASKMFNFSFP